jgi:hypothetical protein
VSREKENEALDEKSVSNFFIKIEDNIELIKD